MLIFSDMLPVNQFMKGRYVVIVSAKVNAWGGFADQSHSPPVRPHRTTDEMSLRCHVDT